MIGGAEDQSFEEFFEGYFRALLVFYDRKIPLYYIPK